MSWFNKKTNELYLQSRVAKLVSDNEELLNTKQQLCEQIGQLLKSNFGAKAEIERMTAVIDDLKAGYARVEKELERTTAAAKSMDHTLEQRAMQIDLIQVICNTDPDELTTTTKYELLHKMGTGQVPVISDNTDPKRFDLDQ